MKRLFTLTVFSLCTLVLSAQGGLERVSEGKGKHGSFQQSFTNGLAKGRSPMEFYKATFTKNNSLTEEKVRAYAEKNNYLVRRIDGRQVDKFGTKAWAINSWEFLPKSELEAFVFARVTGNTSAKAEKKCGVYWYQPQQQLFREYTFGWTGNIVNGKADGVGTAFKLESSGTGYMAFWVSGTFKDGWLQGEGLFMCCSFDKRFPEKLDTARIYSVSASMGPFLEGLASCGIDGSYGFVDATGRMAIAPVYAAVLGGFENGQAAVRDEKGEYYITKAGTFVDWTPKQKRIIAAKDAEAKRAEAEKKRMDRENELKRKREAEEREKQAILAERQRVERIRNAMEGDKIYYSQDWKHTDNFFFFSHDTHYTMRVVCFVEKNVNNGERLQVRVGKVESSNSSYYSVPKIDDIEYRKGDVLWIRPLENKGWQM